MALQPLLRACQSAAHDEKLSIAVLGRFKAGKSSFLNNLIGRELLPIGVVPVTSVITEMQWASEERSEAQFLDGRHELIPMAALAEFVSEARNTGNTKHVNKVCVFLPELAPIQRDPIHRYARVRERVFAQHGCFLRLGPQRRCCGGSGRR